MASINNTGLGSEFRNKKEQAEQDPNISLTYRPPYRFQEMLSFLEGRAIRGVELVANNEYLRTVRIFDLNGYQFLGWLRVGHNRGKNALTATISEDLHPVLPQIIARLRRLFDLDTDPGPIYETLSSMNEICPDVPVEGTRVPGSFDAFEMTVRAVLGQQITVKAASTLAGRLVATFGSKVETGIPELTRNFPLAADIVRLGEDVENRLGSLGIISTRSKTIYELAKAFEDGSINFTSPDDVEAEIEKLIKIPGIGPWTAKYIAMRTMEYSDAFLETDAGIKKALSSYSPKEMLKLAEAWRPWRSYATVNLWNSL